MELLKLLVIWYQKHPRFEADDLSQIFYFMDSILLSIVTVIFWPSSWAMRLFGQSTMDFNVKRCFVWQRTLCALPCECNYLMRLWRNCHPGIVQSVQSVGKNWVSNRSRSLYLIFACLCTWCRSSILNIFWACHDSNYIEDCSSTILYNSDQYLEVHIWTLSQGLICVMFRCPVERNGHNDHLVAQSSVRYLPSAFMVPVVRYLSQLSK